VKKKEFSMRTLLSCAAIGALIISAPAFAAMGHGGGGGAMPMAGARTSAPTMSATTARHSTTTTHTTGQPNQSCGSATAPETPGNAAAAPGSAFNPSGQAGTVYAGQQPQNSNNPNSVSQYDVACSHQR
jgi:hypothetical protein